jgi:hypothetical protein
MRAAIVSYAVVALGVLICVDLLWPVWPVHLAIGALAVAVVALAGLALVAARPRRAVIVAKIPK